MLQYSAYLTFWHPRRLPDEVTQALSIDPDICFDKGAHVLSAQGFPLNRRHKHNYWNATLAESIPTESGLPEVISGYLDRFEPAKSFFQTYVEDGGRVALDILWDTKGSITDDTLRHAHLVRLCDFRLDLGLNSTSI